MVDAGIRHACRGAEKAAITAKSLCEIAGENKVITGNEPCAREAAFSVGFSPDEAQTYLYVADGGSHMIVVLRRSDLMKVDEFAGPGVGTGELGRPHNLTVDPQGNIYVAEAAGPWIQLATGDSVQAGFRAQKFAVSGGGAP